MSIRIRPPSAQSLPTFDEGGLGPPQAAVDEDYLAPLPKWNAALTLQPIADEAALPLSVILDEDAGYPLSRFAPRPLRALVFRASDSPTPSATVAIPDEVTPPLLLTAVRAILQPQPISHTDELPLQIARNEDYLFWQSTDIRRNLPQPFLDEADAPSFANVPVDEDPYVILGKRRADVFGQPYFDEENHLPPQITTGIEGNSDHVELYFIPRPLSAQPFGEADEIPANATLDENYSLSFSYRFESHGQPDIDDADLPGLSGLDEEAGQPLKVLGTAIIHQPIAQEEALPQLLSISVVDESVSLSVIIPWKFTPQPENYSEEMSSILAGDDTALLLPFTIQKAYSISQPISADEERPHPIVSIIDEDLHDERFSLTARFHGQPIHADEEIAQAKILEEELAGPNLILSAVFLPQPLRDDGVNWFQRVEAGPSLLSVSPGKDIVRILN